MCFPPSQGERAGHPEAMRGRGYDLTVVRITWLPGSDVRRQPSLSILAARNWGQTRYPACSDRIPYFGTSASITFHGLCEPPP
jgi:hypothetical protein